MLLKNVVIGSSLASVLYAFQNECYHVRNENFFPTFFNSLQEKVLGQKLERDAFNRVKTMLALMGLNIEFSEVNQISLKENKIIISSNLGVSEFLFEKCFIFSMLNLKHENEILYPKKGKFLVYDDYTITGHPRSHPEMKKIESDTSFVREIYLYNSGRIDGYQYPTDAITVSTLEKDQIYSFEYSDTMANFKLMHDLRLKSEKLKKIKSEHVKRLVFYQDNNVYHDSESVKFLNQNSQRL